MAILQRAHTYVSSRNVEAQTETESPLPTLEVSSEVTLSYLYLFLLCDVLSVGSYSIAYYN